MSVDVNQSIKFISNVSKVLFVYMSVGNVWNSYHELTLTSVHFILCHP